MKIIESFKTLPLRAKQLLSLGIIFALTIALPLFVWGIVSQKFDIREKASTGEPPTPTPIGTVAWSTQWASFSATDYKIQVPDGTESGRIFRVNPSKPCNPITGEMVCVHSDSPDPYPQGLHYMTLEVNWFEHDIEMRMNIYLFSDGQRWWSNEIRVYNGQPYPNSEWVTFYGKFFDTPVGQAFTQSEQFTLSAQDSKTNGPVTLSFSNVRFATFLNYFNPTPTSTSFPPSPSPTLSPSPTSLCTRNQMALAVSPPSQSGVPGQTLRYQVNVTNRDTPGCGPIRVNLGVSVPSNWTATFSTQAFDLAPNHTYSAHLDVTSASQNYFLGPQPIRVNVITTSLVQNVSSEVVYILSSAASPTPTPTPTPSPWYQILKFRIKFGGVEDDSAVGAKVRIRFTKLASGFDYQTPPVDAAYAGTGVYETTVVLVGQNPVIPVGDGYTIFVKGEKHLARKFCYQTGQSSRCLGNGYIYIGATNISSTQTFDFSGLPLEPGDLAIQDGVADINDFGKIRALLSKTCSQLSVEEKATADLDYSGCVNIRDAFLMRKTLEAKYDEY